ncbi:AzlD family protein [Dyella sp. LX-66]|uniref:AzlD family protein n=1 Tax=unclassified Dyella TaxID=2634549 RepID=UPI001BE1211A|nr:MULTISPECIES: AzlD family protein [unclassified Dyella]MBT2118923.1 AzlD family protein [Dyella sp. LX-1]MBT2140083.1 AzlD family protein [Dyella sp. LX-66]
MIEAQTLLAIALMALTTYVTRILGYLVLRHRTPGAQAVAVMEAAPGCVLISVIAPAFVSSRPEDLVALTITLAAAIRWPMLPTVMIGVASAGLLRLLAG